MFVRQRFLHKKVVLNVDDVVEIPGPPGATGATGPAGADGEDGLSAYQVAVANGFVGSEAAWLESLQGEDGEDGDDGAAGPAGPAGPQGIQGIQGIPGPPGSGGGTGLPYTQAFLATGELLTIPARCQLIVHQNYEIELDANLDLVGNLVLL